MKIIFKERKITFLSHFHRFWFLTIFSLLAAAPYVLADGEIVFPDALLKNVVCAALEKDESCTITIADTQSLTSLDASFLEISNLRGLEHFTNLEHLYLGFNNIDDLSPLAGLTSLTELHLNFNSIDDISPLADLTSLTKLNLNGNHIDDLSLLVGLTSLTELNLDSNNINDLSPLAGLTSLTKLYLGSNNIDDLSPLAGLTSLTELYLRYNNINDISSLRDLADLYNLHLNSNPILDHSRGTHVADCCNVFHVSSIDDLPLNRSSRNFCFGIDITDTDGNSIADFCENLDNDVDHYCDADKDEEGSDCQDGLWLYYDFEQSNIIENLIFDEGNFGYVGGFSYINGYLDDKGKPSNIEAIGNGLLFNKNNSISVGREKDFNFINNKFTVEGWFNISRDNSESLSVIEKSIQWNIKISSRNILYATLRGNEIGREGITNIYQQASDQAVNDGTWHHFAAVFDTSADESVKLYVDRALQNTNYRDYSDTHNYKVGTGNVIIGQASNVEYFIGGLDEIKIHLGELDAAAIRRSFFSGSEHFIRVGDMEGDIDGDGCVNLLDLWEIGRNIGDYAASVRNKILQNVDLWC